MESQNTQPANGENESSPVQVSPDDQNGFYRNEDADGMAFSGDQLSESSSQYQAAPNDPDQTLNWTASESVDHHKSGGWYASLMLGICIFAVLIWVITKDPVTPVVVLVCGVVLAGFAATQPRQLTYQLSPNGLTVGNHHYSYNDFKSFTLIRDGAVSSIMLRPLKRFGAWTTIYFEPKDEASVIALLSGRLPHETHQPDAMDRLLRKIRF